MSSSNARAAPTLRTLIRGGLIHSTTRSPGKRSPTRATTVTSPSSRYTSHSWPRLAFPITWSDETALSSPVPARPAASVGAVIPVALADRLLVSAANRSITPVGVIERQLRRSTGSMSVVRACSTAAGPPHARRDSSSRDVARASLASFCGAPPVAMSQAMPPTVSARAASKPSSRHRVLFIARHPVPVAGRVLAFPLALSPPRS